MNEGSAVGFLGEERKEVSSRLRKHAEERYESPYEDQEAKKHTFHAVYEDSSHRTCFMSAPDSEGLKVGLSSLLNVKKVIAVYAGHLIDFHEARDVVLKGV